MKLAYEITKINYGEEIAKAAQKNFIDTIQNKELPAEIETVFDTVFFKTENIDGKFSGGYRKSFVYFLDELVRRRMFSSKSEARRVIEEGGVKVNGVVLKDASEEFEINDKGLVIQRGKKAFLKIIKK
jgi:tyrosyl-tRNA synthetase